MRNLTLARYAARLGSLLWRKGFWIGVLPEFNISFVNPCHQPRLPHSWSLWGSHSSPGTLNAYGSDLPQQLSHIRSFCKYMFSHYDHGFLKAYDSWLIVVISRCRRSSWRTRLPRSPSRPWPIRCSPRRPSCRWEYVDRVKHELPCRGDGARGIDDVNCMFDWISGIDAGGRRKLDGYDETENMRDVCELS